MALHFKCLPTELDAEQVKDYLYLLQQRSNTPSQTYFKHTVYGLRFLLKTEGLPYAFLHLPAIKKDKKLPVILSKEEVWRMLNAAKLLKHRILIGLIYGCGLRCMELRNIRLVDSRKRPAGDGFGPRAWHRSAPSRSTAPAAPETRRW